VSGQIQLTGHARLGRGLPGCFTTSRPLPRRQDITPPTWNGYCSDLPWR